MVYGFGVLEWVVIIWFGISQFSGKLVVFDRFLWLGLFLNFATLDVWFWFRVTNVGLGGFG